MSIRITNTNNANSFTIQEHASAPGTPATGNVVFYAKADGFIYSKDDAGVETQLGGGGGGGTVTSVSGGTTGLTFNTPTTTPTMTGTLLIANGGTGQVTANAALNALLPPQAGNAGEFLTTDGTNTSWAVAGGGSSALSSVTAAVAANSINNGDNAQTWNWALTTGAKTGFTFTENIAATNGLGAQFLVDISTIAASTANPFRIRSRTLDVITVGNTGAVAINSRAPSTGNGNALDLRAGNSISNGDGGDITLLAGAGNTSGTGGTINITAGAGIGGGLAGGINITGGIGNNGGNIVISSGQGTNTNPSSVSIIAAASAVASNGDGGIINVTSGAAGNTSTNNGGPITIASGTGFSGGTIIVRAGVATQPSGLSNIFLQTSGGNTRLTLDKSGNVVIGTAALSTTATNGFLYIPTTPGVPTGVPTTFTGCSALTVDTTNNRLYGYDPVDAVWLNLTGAGGGGGLTISDDTTTNATRYVTFTSATSGSISTANVSSTKLFFNPSTGTLSATAFDSLSDLNLKTNVKKLTNAVSTVNKLEGVEFDWKDTNKHSYGVIAQQIEQILPALVTTDPTGFKSVNYNGIIGVLIEAVKELSAETTELRQQIKRLVDNQLM